MRYGKGPSGIIRSTLNESTLAIWALSHSTCTQMMNDLEATKDGQAQHLVTSHKEEQLTHIKADATDRMNIHDAPSTCIDIFDSDKHPVSGLVDIFSGRVVDDPTVNVHCCLEIGTVQWLEYESQWPSGFYNKLKRNVKTIAAATTRTTKVGQSHIIVDTEFIYARVIAKMASLMQTISIKRLFSHGLASHPTSLFKENGEMRTGSKSVLKNKLQMLCGIRHCQHPMVVILDGCALFWTIFWASITCKAFIVHQYCSVQNHTIY